MKKKLITLTVVAALAPVAALAASTTVTINTDTNITIYGQAHLSVDGSDDGGALSRTKIASSSSRLGVKGFKELGSGLKAVYQLESGVDLSGHGNSAVSGGDGNGGGATGSIFTNARDSFVGLSGGFGSVTLGRHGGANQWVYDVNFFADQVGDAGNFLGAKSNLGGRVNSSLMYATPDMSGFKAMATYVAKTNAVSPAAGSESSYILRGTYDNGPASVALTYANAGLGGTARNEKATSLAGNYDFGAGKAGVQYLRLTDVGEVAGANINIYTLGGSFKVTSNGAVKAQYSKAGNLSGAANTGASMYALGYDHNLGKDVTLYVAYANTTNDAGATYTATDWGHGGNIGVAAAGKDPHSVSVGVVYKF